MVAGTVGGTGIERIKGTDKEGLLDVTRVDRSEAYLRPEAYVPECARFIVATTIPNIYGSEEAVHVTPADRCS